MDPESLESKFTKSGTNKRTENSGLAFLLADRRIQWVDTPTKRRILELIGVIGAFGTQTFDAVMTNDIRGPITVSNIDEAFPQLRLIEMKTTRKPIRNSQLNGFFFGATEREYAMAKALGEPLLYKGNDFGHTGIRSAL